MMKRNILAVVIPALLAAGAVNAAEVYNKDGNKVDLYGKVTAKHRFSDNNGQDGDKSYARLGVKGETQINSDVTGYGRYEVEFAGNKSEDGSDSRDVKTRYAFAGLKIADFGTIDYGRNLGIAYDSLAYTDVLPEWGGDQSNSDNFLTGRSTGVLTYRNKDFFGLVDGLNFGLQYQGKNSKDTLNERDDRDTSNGDGWGTSLEYVSPVGVGIIANYAAVSRTVEQNAVATDSGRGKKAEAWGTGLKYDANNIYVAAIYSELRNASYINKTVGGVHTDFADKTKIFEAVAQYNFDFGLTPSLGYVSGKAKDDTNNRNAYITKYVSLGATYAFNKNFSVYTEYDINLIKDTNAYGINDDDKVAVGVTYQF
ncbi:porin [Candidatus Symbiopectobacterium sp. NZEC151]|uniref:porin n=1 Tax=Candidatus Symbiopectobacterium sp. NZEC151 TaxID=2820470 RepID=UPI0029CAB2CF|nr:porin [Candidatus Symbiopectobacterium sp. NZEC151]